MSAVIETRISVRRMNLGLMREKGIGSTTNLFSWIECIRVVPHRTMKKGIGKFQELLQQAISCKGFPASVRTSCPDTNSPHIEIRSP